MDTTLSEVSASAAVSSLTAIVICLVCICFSWWALQNLKLDLIIRHPKGPQGKLLHLLFAIVLGKFVADFIIQYLSYTHMLRYLF
ncbi:DUF1146 family protein [Paenibacillus pinistramenti]|uniref:DUF1146 family protein n=1 Tax=Paenibacillus pinistramenti TaxID=1768003 RepID=UPI00110924F5|nr:DUF1146 family protein [Paenibacillus pinistramenti]